MTVRNIPDDAKLRFRKVAAAHGRSMEDHLRQLIMNADIDDEPTIRGVSDVATSFRHFEGVAPPTGTSDENWVDELVRLANGADLQVPPRSRTPHIPPEL